MHKKIENSFWKKCLFFVLLMSILTGLYAVALRYVKVQRDLSNLTPDDFCFVFQVDKVLHENNEIILDGWSFMLGEDAVNGRVELWLYDLEEEKIVYPVKTRFTKRSEVNEYFLCEYDYTDCGILASFDEEKLNLENKEYEVLVLDTESKTVYQTETYISNGELMYCLPEKYNELEVADTDIEKIVKDGVLRVYRSDVGMYVYQYEGALYWIAEPYYSFVDEDTYVQFQLNTTQIEKLPEERLANNWFWSNKGFLFKSKELTEWNTGKYRVAKCELPLDYSITEIWTGKHIEEWIWIQYFRPWYDFVE